MRLETYNAAPFEFELPHAEGEAFASMGEAPLAEAPADTTPPPPAADEVPSELLRNLARHPPAHSLPPPPSLRRGVHRDDMPAFEDAPALWRRESRGGFEPGGGHEGELSNAPPLPEPVVVVESAPPAAVAPPAPPAWAGEPTMLTWNETPGSRGWVETPVAPAWVEEAAVPAWVPEPAPQPPVEPVLVEEAFSAPVPVIVPEALPVPQPVPEPVAAPEAITAPALEPAPEPVAAIEPAPEPAAAAPAPAPLPQPAPAAAAAPTELALPLGPGVHPDWLAQRETALQALRSDFEAAREAARATPPADVASLAGSGWVPAPTDGDGHPANGAVFVSDAAAAVAALEFQPAWMLREGMGAPAPQGQWLSFDDDAYEQAYRERLAARARQAPSGPLATLGQLYGQPAADVLATHPELWTLATRDHALNAGPPPRPGVAMGDAMALGQLDLYLADPFITQLRTQLGGTPAAPASGLALEQQRLYGAERYAELTQLSQAMTAVRQTHAAAMQAARAGGGSGWIEVPLQFGTDPETGWPTGIYETLGEGEIVRDANGGPVLAKQRVFDEALFTNAWLAEDGVAQQAFARFYGGAHSHITLQHDQSESAGPPRWVSQPSLDNPHVGMDDSGVWDGELIKLDLNHAPRLNNDVAVGFDPQLGWVTPRDNIYERVSTFDRLAPIAVVAFVGWATGGAALAANWGAVGAAAAAGAAASFAGGVINGNLSLKGVLIGAVSGALTAGLTPGLSSTLKDAGLGAAAAGVAARMTVQGGIQALLGGKFKDGAIAGFASGLAELASASIGDNIKAAEAARTMTASEALAARTFNTMLSSAIRAAGNPGDPAHAFASSWLDGLMNEFLPPVPGPVQGERPWSSVDHRNGSDVESDLAGVVQTFRVPDPRPVDVTPLPPAEGQRPVAPLPGIVTAPLVGEVSGDEADADPLPGLRAGVERAFSYQAAGRSSIGLTLVAGDRGDLNVNLDANAAVVRDPQGRYLYASAASTAALPDGWQVVAGPGQTMLLGPAGSVVLPAGLTGKELMLATALSQPALGMGMDGWAPSATGAFNPPAWLGAGVKAGMHTLILSPSVIGGGDQVSDISSDIRLVRPGLDVLEGVLELRWTDAQGGSHWIRVENAAFTEGEARSMSDRITRDLRRDALTPEQIAQLGKPLIYVPAPPSTPLPGFVTTPRDSDDNLLINPIPAPAEPGIEGFPIHEPKTIDELIITSRGFEPGSAAHKAATWDFYLERGGDWEYDRWSSVYEANQTRAAQANAEANRYHETLNWGAREVTIEGITVDGHATTRRLDIADKDLQKGVEYKTGYQTATVDNMWELKRDAELVRRGWDIEWVFRDRASEPLLDALRDAGIRVKVVE